MSGLYIKPLWMWITDKILIILVMADSVRHNQQIRHWRCLKTRQDVLSVIRQPAEISKHFIGNTTSRARFLSPLLVGKNISVAIYVYV